MNFKMTPMVPPNSPEDFGRLAILGFYIQPKGPHGLDIAQPFFGMREIPQEIINRGPVGRMANCVQILINSFEAYQWINIPKDWEIRMRGKYEKYWDKWCLPDPKSAFFCDL